MLRKNSPPRRLARAAAKPYDALRNAHVADHRWYFRRVALTLCPDQGDTRPASARSRPPTSASKRSAQGTADARLMATWFQYGRYLLLASSRPGDLPANLQGIWAEGIQTPWNDDYHNNIDVEMNYWPAEPVNLAECALPLVELIDSLRPAGRKTARAYYGANGWTVHAITNVWGFTSPGEQPGWGLFPAAGGWLCRHPWEHYAFSGDTEFLRRAWPIMKESAEFYLDWLVEDPKTGKLVGGPSNSPENQYVTPNGGRAWLSMGTAMDQQIIWDLFTNVLEAAEALDIRDEFVDRVRRARERLLGPQIAADGRLMEWSEEFVETEPGHRHLSHLFALYPGRQITPRGTPELAAAARKSLEHRLAHGGGPGAFGAWVANLFARLEDGDKALEHLSVLLGRSTTPNLLTTSGPFQICANFGATAAIAEMLVESHAGEIALLPALAEGMARRIGPRPAGARRRRGGHRLEQRPCDEGRLAGEARPPLAPATSGRTADRRNSSTACPRQRNPSPTASSRSQ